MPYIRVVSKATATNPVARAVARQKLHSKLLEEKIRVYLLTDKDDYKSVLSDVVLTLEPMIMAACIEISVSFAKLGPSVVVMRAGRDACVDAVGRDTYEGTQAAVICAALDAAEFVNPRVSPLSMQKALYELTGAGPHASQG